MLSLIRAILAFGLAYLCAGLLPWPSRSNLRHSHPSLKSDKGDNAIRQEPSKWISRCEPPRPTYVKNEEGREYIWQLPKGDKPAGVLLLAPGCNHRAVDFWDPAPECPDCIGLPEEKQIVCAALDSRMAVLAVSTGGQGQNQACWDTTHPDEGQNTDLDATIRILRAWMKSTGSLADLPVFALGASSGGAFVLLLGLRFPLAAICAQIMAVPSYYLYTKPSSTAGETWPYPPTLFIHMARDRRTAAGVSKNIKALRSLGVQTAEIAVHPQPMTPQSLAVRIEGMTGETSMAIFKAFRDANVLDVNGMLTRNPRASATEPQPTGWRAAISNLQGTPGLDGDNLLPDRSSISEELNVFYAGHEIMADYMQQTMLWFAEHLPQ